MLAISMAAPAPHLLSRLDPAPALSIFPPENLRSLNPMSPGKRPKLSLNTSDLAPTYTGATSGRNNVNVDATATPTTLNTFTNAFDLTYRPSPASTLPSPGSHFPRRTTGHSSSPVPKMSERPYDLNLPFGVYPILKNSPLPRDVRRPSICSTSASPRIPGRRVFFPAPKKVTFRAELEDEIITKEYVKRHADLSSSEDEAIPSESDEQSGASTDEGEDEVQDRGIRVDEISPRGRRKRKSAMFSDVSTDRVDGRGRNERSRSTSVRRSKRKKRRWEWTIETTASAPKTTGKEAGDGKEGQLPAVEGSTKAQELKDTDRPEEFGQVEDAHQAVEEAETDEDSPLKNCV